MDGDDVLERLLATGIIKQHDGAGSVSLTDGFEAALSTHLGELADADRASAYLSDVEGIEDPGAVSDVLDDNGTLVSTYATLAEFSDGFDQTERLQLLPMLVELQHDSPFKGGIPEAFLSVPGDCLDPLLTFFSSAIVYVYREDCDPCSLLRDELDDIFPEHPDDVALFAVYGPEWAELLQTEYDVAVGPTTLFVLDGSVDSRLVGAPARSVLEEEVEIIRNS
jgi:hypothetical protein